MKGTGVKKSKGKSAPVAPDVDVVGAPTSKPKKTPKPKAGSTTAPTDELPSAAIMLANDVAHGKSIKEALIHANVTAQQAHAWVTHPKWPELVKRESTAKAFIDEKMASMLPRALDIKKELLDSDNMLMKAAAADSVIGHFTKEHNTVERKVYDIPAVELNLMVLVLDELSKKGDDNVPSVSGDVDG